MMKHLASWLLNLHVSRVVVWPGLELVGVVATAAQQHHSTTAVCTAPPIWYSPLCKPPLAVLSLSLAWLGRAKPSQLLGQWDGRREIMQKLYLSTSCKLQIPANAQNIHVVQLWDERLHHSTSLTLSLQQNKQVLSNRDPKHSKGTFKDTNVVSLGWF